MIIMKEFDCIISPEFYNSVISAELPADPEDALDEETKVQRKRLQDVVLTNMVHRPWGEKCMKDGKRTKKFPKPFLKQTYI